MNYNKKTGFNKETRINQNNSIQTVNDKDDIISSPLNSSFDNDNNACTLRFSDRHKITIHNINNANKTLINGIPLLDSAEITHKDIINLNDSIIKITCSDSKKDKKKVLSEINLHSNNKEGFNRQKVHFSHKFDLSKGPIANSSSAYYSTTELAKIVNSICTLTNTLNQTENENEIVDISLEKILQLSPLKKCAIVLSNQSNKNILNPISYLSVDKKEKNNVFTVNADIIKFVLKSSNSLIIADKEQISLSNFTDGNIEKNIFCAPLCGHNNILGVIYAEATEKYLPERDINLLAIITSIAEQIGIAFERRRQDQRLKKMFLGSMLALTASIEAKDKYTKGHSERVTCYALMIADELNLPESERIIVEIAGLLHDIGKIGVPETVLCSPDKLTTDEYEYMKQHPQIGADIVIKMPDLKGIASVSKVASAIKHHHEKFDGTGYPSGISGNKIPVSARILAIADTFDAITSNRTYRLGQSAEKAIDILEQSAGKQVDPKLFNVFKKIYKRGDLAYPERVKTMIDFDIAILKESTVISR